MGPAAKSAATSEAAGPERYRRVVPRLRAGGPMMPPSTKRAPAASTMRPISRAVAGDTALPSTKIPRNPVAATARARSTAPCGGITERITRLDFTRSASVRASSSRLSAARALVAALRPWDTHNTRAPPATRVAPAVVPISPGFSSPTVTFAMQGTSSRLEQAGVYSCRIRPADALLAVLVAVIWGFAFVVTRVGLDSFSPPQLTALRFLIAATPAIWWARPLAWRALVPLGLTLFAGQFLMQFFAIANGMPPGLASIVVQTQAFFTILFVAVASSERPRQGQMAGIALAFIGLGLIALTIGGDLRAVSDSCWRWARRSAGGSATSWSSASAVSTC